MSRKLFTGRGHRRKWRRDAESVTIQKILRENLSHQNGRLAESKSFSQATRSIIVKDYGSGHTEYAMGTNSAGVDHGFGSGFSSGEGSADIFSMHSWLSDGIQTEEESHTRNSNEKGHDPSSIQTMSYPDGNTNTRQVDSNLNFVLKPKVEPIKTKTGIISVLTHPARKKRSVAYWFTGSGDNVGSGSSSDEHITLSGSEESSGTSTIEEVIINSHAVPVEYVQGQREQVGLSAGSGSSTCVGIGCEIGSGTMHIAENIIITQQKPTNSEVETVPGEQVSYSGMYAVDHHRP